MCVCSVHYSQLNDSGEVEGEEDEGIKKCVDIKVVALRTLLCRIY